MEEPTGGIHDKNEQHSMLNLEELRQVNPKTEVDKIKQKLAQLFELQEFDASSNLVDSQISKEQYNALYKIYEISDKYLETVNEKSRLEKELTELVDRAENLRTKKSRDILDVNKFPELHFQLPRLVAAANEIRFVASLRYSENMSIDDFQDLSDLFDQHTIPYNKHDFELTYLSFSQLDGLKKKIEKAFLKLRKRKQGELLKEFSVAIKSLETEQAEKLNEKVKTFSSKLLNNIEGIKEKTNKENLLDNVKELLTLYQYLEENIVEVNSSALPEEYQTLKQTFTNKISSTINELIQHYQNERKKSQDISPDSHDVLSQLTTLLSKMEQILPQVRNAADKLIKTVQENNTDTTFTEIEAIKLMYEEKRMVHFAVKHPDKLRKNLYNMYRELDLPKDEKKRFLKIAIKLLEEFTSTQTESFLAGYDEVYNIFAQAGLNEIPLTEIDIRKIFLKQGYEISSEGKIDFSNALARAKNMHNSIVDLLSSKIDLKKSDPTLIGRELFQARIRTYGFDTANFPYGKVTIDVTSPISSIRLIIHDTRDYKFIAGELDADEYKKGNDSHNRGSGGTSFPGDTEFIMEDNSKISLPFTIINGSQSEKSIVRTQKHEDAHQAIITGNEYDNVNYSAEKRVSNTVFKDFSFDTVVLSEYGHMAIVNEWREIIKGNLLTSLLNVRDEVQAYLAGGDNFKFIKSELSDVSETAFYDYICHYSLRVLMIKKIKEKFKEEAVQKKLIRIFKRDVMKARDLFDSQRDSFIDKVENLYDLFDEKDSKTAKSKVSILVRHTTPDEISVITRYLRRSKKHTEEKRSESEDDFTFKEQFLKLPVYEKLLALKEDEFSKLLNIAKPAIKVMITFLEKIINATPKHLYDLIPELDSWPIQTPVTEQGIKNLLTVHQKVMQRAISKIYWTPEEKKLSEEFINTLGSYQGELNDQQYLIHGKNFLEYLNESINTIF